MDLYFISQFWVLIISIFYITTAQYSITPSSSYAVKNRDFHLTCNIGPSSSVPSFAINWRRNGKSVAIVQSSNCETYQGSGGQDLYQRYTYNCTSNRSYSLYISATKIDSEDRSVWRCEDNNINLESSSDYTLVVYAQYSITPSSSYAVKNREFHLTCNIGPSSTVPSFGIIWRRNGQSVAIVQSSNCQTYVGAGEDLFQRYTYNCTSNRIYNLYISATQISSEDGSVWRCEDNNINLGSSGDYTLVVYVPVSSVNIQGDSGYPAVNVLYENKPKTFMCITNGCRPEANITVTTTGVSDGQSTKKLDTQHDSLTVTIVSQTITATRDGSLKTFQCSAENIQGIQPITSQTLTLEVYYSPVISLNKSPVVVSEGQSIRRICSAFGNPKPKVNWYREHVPYTSGTGTTATLIIEKTTRNDSGTYTCKAEAGVQNGNQSQIFSNLESIQIYVYYITSTKPEPVCSSSDSISMSCCSVINSSKPIRFYGWKHRIKNTTIRSLEGKQLTASNNSLFMDYCGYYDSGVYTCEAAVDIYHNNSWQRFISSIEVIVPAPPVVSYSTVIDRNENISKTLSVQFYSNPKPDLIEWIKDDEKLTFSNKHQQITSVTNVRLLFYSKYVVVKGYESSLSIINPVDSDYGTYIFKVQNSEGSAQRKLIMNKNITDGTDELNISGAVIVGVIAVIALIAIVVSGFCIFKRLWHKKNDTPGNNTDSKDSNSLKTNYSSGSNTNARSYQDIDIQTYETLASPSLNTDQYETLPEERM